MKLKKQYVINLLKESNLYWPDEDDTQEGPYVNEADIKVESIRTYKYYNRYFNSRIFTYMICG